MTGFTIIIAAKNLAGKVMDSIKAQMEGLNEGVKKWRHAIMGVTAVAAGFYVGIKNLISASTKTDELENSFAGVEKQWQRIKGTIGDGLVDILEKLAAPAEWLMGKLKAVMDFLRTIAGAAGYFFTSLSLNTEQDLSDLFKESWQAGKETVDELDAEADERRAEREAKAAREAQERESSRLEEKLAYTRARNTENAERSAINKADNEDKLRLLDAKRERLKSEYRAKLDAIAADSTLSEDNRAKRAELEKLEMEDKLRQVADEREKIEALITAEKKAQAKIDADKARDKAAKGLQQDYEETETAFNSWLERNAEKIKALKAGIEADKKEASALDEVATRHRARAGDLKAARKADVEAAREERRWQHRLERAQALSEAVAKGKGGGGLPRWAREVLDSENARKAADQARAAAAAKQTELDKAEKRRAQALVDMKNDLSQIKGDLKAALYPA